MKRLILLCLLSTISLLGFSQVFSEDFEGSLLDKGWLTSSATATEWQTSDCTFHGPGAAYSGSKGIIFDNYKFQNNNQGILTSPSFDLSSQKNPSISFFWWNGDGVSSPARIQVKVSTDGNSFRELFILEAHSSADWAEYKHSIPKDVVKIQLIGISDYGNKNTFVDLLTIGDPEDYLFDATSSVDSEQNTALGEKSTFSFDIKNTGALSDTYTLSYVSSSSWAWSMNKSGSTASVNTITVAAGDTQTVEINTTLATAGVQHAHKESLSVKIVSQAKATSSKNISYTVNAIAPLVSSTGVFTFDFNNFTEDKLPLGWGVLNLDNNSNYWNVSKQEKCLLMDNKYNSTDDWLITQPLVLKANTSYRVKFNIKGGTSYYKGNIALAAGKNETAILDASNIIYENKDFEFSDFTETDAFFQTSTAGSYSVGFHSMSSTIISIDDIIIETAPDYDVRLKSSIEKADIVAGESFEYLFKVTNKGGKKDIINLVADFKFPTTIKNSDGATISEISLDPQETKDVVVLLSIPTTGLTNAELNDFKLTVNSTNLASKTDSHIISTTMFVDYKYPYLESFENSLSSWNIDSEYSVITNTNVFAGSSSVHIKSERNENTDLELNSFIDLKDAISPVLEFKHNISIGSYDNFRVKVKVFGEDLFDELEGDTYTGSPKFDAPNSRNAFNKSSLSAWNDTDKFDDSAWKSALFDLSAYKGKKIVISFEADYGSYIGQGWLIDNVAVKEAPEYIFTVESLDANIKANTQEWSAHKITIQNKGSRNDVYNISSQGNAWVNKFYNASNNVISTISVDAGASKNIVVKTQVAADAKMGDIAESVIIIKSAGDASQKNIVKINTTAISALSIPYFENFDNDDSKNLLGWSTLNSNNDDKEWGLNSYYSHSPSKTYSISNIYNNVAIDDWLISTPVNLVAGKTYRVSSFIRSIGDDVEKFSIHYAQTKEISDFNKNVLLTKEDLNSQEHSKITSSFVAPNTGVYYIAYHAFSDARTKGIALDDFKIDLLVDKDVKINSVEKNITSFIFANNNIVFTVEVENNGASSISGKTLSLQYKGATILSQTIDNLAKAEKRTLSFSWNAKAGLNNEFTFKLSSDDNNANNEKNISLDVYKQGLLLEEFESTTFPATDKWQLSKEEGKNWSLYRSGGYMSENNAILQSNYSKTSDAKLITPELNIIAGDKLVFYAKRSDDAGNKLSVEYNIDGGEFVKLTDVVLTEDYTKTSIDLNNLTGKKIRISFHGTTPSKYGEEINLDRIIGPSLAGELKSEMIISPSLGGIAHEFDSVYLGSESKSFDINIKNKGNDILVLTKDNVSVKGKHASEYSINAKFPITVNPQSTFVLKLICKPTSVGLKSASIYITDPNDDKRISVKQFNTKVNPAQAVLMSPLNKQANIALNTELNWQDVDAGYSIDLYLSEKMPFTQADKVLSGVSSVSKLDITDKLENAKRYFWQISISKTVDGKEYVSKSDVYSFSTLTGDNIVQVGDIDKLGAGLESLPMSCGTDELSYMTYSQTIYNKKDLNIDDKRIYSIYYYYNGEQAFHDEIVIYMANTDKEFLGGGDNGWVEYNKLQEVYRGSFDAPAIEGWVAIDLPIPFVYDNTKNLVIGFDANLKSIQNSNAGFYYKETPITVTKYKRHHAMGGNPDPSSSNLSGMAVRRMPITRFGLVAPPKKPILYSAASKINFSLSGLGQKPKQEITLQNTGVGLLTISEISIIGSNADNFEILKPVSSTFSIKEAERQAVEVVFTPLSAGRKTAVLLIKNNAGDDLRIAISAEAKDTKITKFPFKEDFESGIFPLAGWNNDEFWMLAGSGHESKHSVTCEYNRIDDAIISTPVIALPANHRLTFMWKNRYTPGGRLGNFDFTFVEISEDNGVNWVELENFTRDKESMSFEKLSVDLSAYGQKDVKIRWRHSITNSGYRTMHAITLDDIVIEEIPYTPAVSSVILEVMNDVNIKVSWEAPVMDPSKPKNNLLGYYLYRNGRLVQDDLITNLEYIDKSLKKGEYEYVIRAIYEKGESNLSMPDNALIDIETAYPVKDLEAEVFNKTEKLKKVKLTWEKPVKKKTIKRIPTDDTYGPAKTGKYNQQQIWISNYAPKGHHEVAMFKFDLEGLTADKIETVTLRINQLFMANDYNTEPSKVYALSNDWNEDDYDFSAKPKYDESKVWAEYYFGSNGWQEVDITDLVKAWLDGSVENNGLCLVASEGDRLRVLESKETFVAANRPHINIITEEDESNVAKPSHGKGIGYKVYRNGEEIATIDSYDTTEFTDVDLPANFYSYTVTAMYSKAGESEHCKPKIVNVSLNDESAWTWMIYLYEDGTGLSGAEDINELEVLGSVPGMVNYIVLYDSDDDEKDGIYLIEKDPEGENNTIVSKKISSQFGKDPRMSDWNLLSDFMIWTKDQFPAKNYALTMWDHGNGIFRSGEEETVRSFVGNMNLWEMDKALDKFTKATDKKLEIVGFDLCLLGQAETVYQLKDYTKYVIASEKTEPGDGWDYVTQFSALNDNPMISSRDLCVHMVDKYVESYSAGGNSNMASVTQAATDTEMFDKEMIPSLNKFAGSLIDNLFKYKVQITKAREYSWNSKRNKDHKDIGHFAELIAADASLPADLVSAAKDFISIYSKTIVASGSTEKVNEDVTGLRIWMPLSISQEADNANIYLDRINFLKFNETLWDEFLFNFENPSESPRRITAKKTEYIVKTGATSLSIDIKKSGDGDIYWNIDQLSTWFDTQDTQLLNSNTIKVNIDENKGLVREGKIFITAKGVIGCPMEITIIQESNIKTLTDQQAEINQKNIKLKWKLPKSTVDVTSIKILRDNKVIKELSDISINTFEDKDLDDALYTYNIVLVYGDYSSEKSEDLDLRIITKLYIDNFDAKLESQNIKLSWNTDEEINDFVSYSILLNGKEIALIDDINTNEYLYEYKNIGEHKFNIQIKYKNSISDMSDAKTVNVESVTTGINDISVSEMIIYPNPILEHFFYINANNLYISKIEIFSTSGKLLYNKTVNNLNNCKINSGFLSGGMYIIKVYTNKGERSYKIIKQ